MGYKLYIGSLAWATTKEVLQEGFSPYGKILNVKVIYDRETGLHKGYAFVTFEEEESAQKAKEALDGKSFDGRVIKVDFANDGQNNKIATDDAIV